MAAAGLRSVQSAHAGSYRQVQTIHTAAWVGLFAAYMCENFTSYMYMNTTCVDWPQTNKLIICIFAVPLNTQILSMKVMLSIRHVTPE